MPKINVYLPDDLAEAVKETGLPVSAVCQRALEVSVKRVSAIRAAVIGDLSDADPTAGLTQFTQRAKNVVTLAITNARERGAAEVGTRDLLSGMVTEGTNLALHVLRSIDVDPQLVLRAVGELAPPEGGGDARRMSTTAANALEMTVAEAIALGHNYVGCEHLLLGLLAEPDGAGGEVLRGLGVELRAARHAVGAALMGYEQAKLAGASPVVNMVNQAIRTALEPVLRRLDRLEARAG
ncbi:MAG TPA: Clp protease N-terminal domain-containing protein [Actinophytocola sp.]|jgi:ATP-dependent Clp protease ATP-binding subunit ClpC|uniref:Clp protease N-terminal domain-containing protein n=1 Tax=Actinophytocola sp. TaxID=1872138 RepID=UPI002F92DD4D